jgi:hypothetical protein
MAAHPRRTLRELLFAVLIVVSYDVRDNRRRTRLAEVLKDFG